ncbi:MAG: hypothetical protein ACP6IP_04690 [Candidatus Njordarchaeia archaeon]
MESRDPFLSKLGVLSKIGIPVPISYSITVLVLYHIWLIFIHQVFGVEFPTFNNIFYVRDLLLIIIFLPSYAIFSQQVGSLQFEVMEYVDMDEEAVQNIFKRLYDRLCSRKKLTFFCILFSTYYFALTTWYLISGYYSLDFYLFRMVSVIGLAILGGVIYQMFVLIKFFLTDAKLLELGTDVFFEGIPPIRRFIFLTAMLWLSMSFIDTLTTFILGFNRISVIWYITFHGLLYFISMLLIFSALQGFHRRLLEMKKIYLEYILDIAPEGAAAEEELGFTPTRNSKLISLLETGEIEPKKFRTWPISKLDTLKLSILIIIGVFVIIFHII